MGSIVWVRRRNGSWWPGKVLGPDELSSTHLMSPRSGTPVKLLGREDASVDWYNLEKSKRVKAFRCGEFDDCIEKAEASLGLPAKKREREKYARRDDAIVHALRLEKEFLEKKYEDVGDYSISVKNCSSNYVVKDLASSGTLENGTSEHGSLKFWPLQRKTGLSVGNRDNHSPSSSRKGRSVDLQASLYSEVKPLMRDLQDLGMKTVHPKLMATSSAALNDSHEMMIDDEGHAFGSSSDADSENTSARVKGLMYGRCVNNQEFRINTNRHTDYLHNGENNAQVERSRGSCLPSESNYIAGMEGSTSGQIEIFGSHILKGTRHSGHNGFRYKLPTASSEDTESDSSETDSLEHAIDAEMKRNSGTFGPMDPHRPLLNQPDMVEDESLSSGDEDSMSPEYAPQYPHHNSICKDRMSRWQLKRKRNARCSPRKSVDRLISTSYQNAGGRPLWRRRNDGMSYYHVNNNGFASDVEFFDNDDVQAPSEREHGYNRGYLSNPQSAIRRHEVFVGDDSMESWMWRDRFCGGLWGGRNGSGFSPFYTGGRRGRIMLVDVDLKVEAQHRRDERVRWVSITSDLNGNSIVGHPIGVEKLEDGSTDYLVSTGNPDFDNYRNSSRMMVPPLRHATKRSSANVLQVPRPNIFSSPQGEDDDNLYCDEDQRMYRTAVAGLPAQRNNSLVHKLSSPSNKSKKKKMGKKSSLCPTLKFRPLTSIGIGHSVVSDDSCYNMDLGSAGPPTVACIPLKLVFSRLLEAVGKPPPCGPATHLPRGIDAQQ